jgi:CrcB protein
MMKTLVNTLAVAAGGAAGSVCRYWLGLLCGSVFSKFPVGTFIINVTGCFIIGCFVTLSKQRLMREALFVGVTVGFVGGYTTFSTYMLESFNLIEQGSILKAMLNVVGSILVGLLAVWLGIVVAKRMWA